MTFFGDIWSNPPTRICNLPWVMLVQIPQKKKKKLKEFVKCERKVAKWRTGAYHDPLSEQFAMLCTAGPPLTKKGPDFH